ncbi:MAG TPA: photosynthetic reaction center cytochrome c subunit family protein [Gemmatimonadaceae bacterium]|nr:photosynthetic reaction center cytochrome c subunit family protein [Gemmatimonadaceae bacterium]
MQRSWYLLSLMLPVVALAQQPGTAGEHRPKLEVLQSLPESQLFPLMNLVATSLGVRCDYCHVQANPDLSKTPSNTGGWVWASDDKLPKRRAREMMKMVVDLNTTRFHGEAKVTCFTCHRGSTRPARLPVLPPAAEGAARTASSTPLPPADRVWAAYVAAVGGVTAQPRGTATYLHGWDDRSEGRYGKFDLTVDPFGRFRLGLTTADGTTNQWFDGDTGAISVNGRVYRFSSPAETARIRRLGTRYQPVKEAPPNARIVGIERVDDRDTYVLEGKFDSVTTRRSYFDVVTGLLRREITTTETLLLPLEEQVDYDDYRNVDGMQMPFRIRISDGAPYSTTTRTMVEIKRNVPVADTLFRPPPATPPR